MQWQQWASLSAALTPPPRSTGWPSVLFLEHNISCSHVEVPPATTAMREMWVTPGWHTPLNSDNRKWVQSVLLTARHITGRTLKPTLLARWHMLIARLCPRVHLHSQSDGAGAMKRDPAEADATLPSHEGRLLHAGCVISKTRWKCKMFRCGMLASNLFTWAVIWIYKI